MMMRRVQSFLVVFCVPIVIIAAPPVRFLWILRLADLRPRR
nr:MAG TPA: hypothetical protein [Caudoviricetes sp.]